MKEVILMCALVSLSTAAHALTIRDEHGARVATIENGVIRNRIGMERGRVIGEHVEDRSGNLLGKVQKNGIIRDAAGRRFASFDSEGQYKVRGIMIAHMVGNNLVDLSGNTIYQIEGRWEYYIGWIAVYLLFFER